VSTVTPNRRVDMEAQQRRFQRCIGPIDRSVGLTAGLPHCRLSGQR
jgi:hypothetical protein